MLGSSVLGVVADDFDAFRRVYRQRVLDETVPVCSFQNGHHDITILCVEGNALPWATMDY